MVLARWQATIVDDAGNVLSGASVEVRQETAGAPLATIYSDRAGTSTTGNPLTVGTDGFAAFYVAGGAYKITATSGSFSRTWRYVAIGTMAEQDADNVSITGYADFTEISEPAAPDANTARLRAIDDGSGVTTFGMQDSAGNAVSMSHATRAETGAVTRAQYLKARDFLTALDFGVTPNSAIDDSVRMQRAINAAIDAGLPLNLPGGNIRASALSILGPLKMIGAGHLNTVFLPESTTDNVIAIDSFLGVTLEDFGIDAQGITMTNGAGIYVSNTESPSNRVVESIYRGVRVIGTFYGIVFDRASTWVMDHSYVYGCKNIGVIVRNLFDDDEGDSAMIGCTVGFFDPVPTSDNILIYQADSGGLKITGCKLIGGYHGYHLGLAAGSQTLGPIISGCSIENQTVASIFMGADNPATSLIGRTTIVGNEIAPFGNGHGIQIIGSVTANWNVQTVIAGNSIQLDLDGSVGSPSSRGITIDYAREITIVGNNIRSPFAGTTVGLELGSNVQEANHGYNSYYNLGTKISDSSTSHGSEDRVRISSAGVLDFGAGDVLVTHSSNNLAFSGGTYNFDGLLQTADLYRARGGTPGLWLDETDGTIKGAYWVLDTGSMQVQRRATNFGAFEATVVDINISAPSSFTINSSGRPGFPAHNTTASAANAFLVTSGGELQRSTSSSRYKSDVEDLESFRTDCVFNLRPIWYRSKCSSDNPKWSWYGLLAEEVAKVEPRLVIWAPHEDDYDLVDRKHYHREGGRPRGKIIETIVQEKVVRPDARLVPDGVDYARLSVMLLDVVKRQEARIAALETRSG